MISSSKLRTTTRMARKATTRQQTTTPTPSSTSTSIINYRYVTCLFAFLFACPFSCLSACLPACFLARLLHCLQLVAAHRRKREQCRADGEKQTPPGSTVTRRVDFIFRQLLCNTRMHNRCREACRRSANVECCFRRHKLTSSNGVSSSSATSPRLKESIWLL